MLLRDHKSQLPIAEFLANPAAPILIDVRGSGDADPAIPGSQRVYLLDIEERAAAFESRFASQLVHRPMLLYCSKGEGSYFLVGKFSGKYRV